jgi:hypothetical protein
MDTSSPPDYFLKAFSQPDLPPYLWLLQSDDEIYTQDGRIWVWKEQMGAVRKMQKICLGRMKYQIYEALTSSIIDYAHDIKIKELVVFDEIGARHTYLVD